MDLKQCSDEELIVRYRDGDTDAMDFIFERYKHLVRKKAKAMFLAGGDNDDLIQEGMIGLYKAIRDYNSYMHSAERRGVKRGQEELMKQLVKKKLGKGKEPEVIADELELEVSDLQRIIREIKEAE